MGGAGSATPSPQCPLFSPAPPGALRNRGGARDRRQRSEMPKVAHGASAPPKEADPGSQAGVESRGQPKHLPSCSAGGRAGPGLGQPGFSLFLCVHKVGLV